MAGFYNHVHAMFHLTKPLRYICVIKPFVTHVLYLLSKSKMRKNKLQNQKGQLFVTVHSFSFLQGDWIDIFMDND